MGIRIELMHGHSLAVYDDFVRKHPNAMLYHSPSFLSMLEYVTNGEPYLLSAHNNGEIVGVLPFFISQDLGLGRVINSLPFFGSHGGALVNEKFEKEAIPSLLDGLEGIARERNCVASSIILTPFDSHEDLYKRHWEPTFEDGRVGQMLSLPSSANVLYSQLANAKRRNIKSALKKGVTVIRSSDPSWIEWIKEVHEAGIGSKGGITKPPAFFDWCRSQANRSDLFTIYFAKVQERLAAALLLFYYAKDVEYYLPVVEPSFSHFYPLVYTVFHAMCDAIQLGYKRWNFGGTWYTQEGVYRFKKEFGANDYPYKYLTKVYSEDILYCSAEKLILFFPYYYVVPFSELHPFSCTS